MVLEATRPPRARLLTDVECPRERAIGALALAVAGATIAVAPIESYARWGIEPVFAMATIAMTTAMVAFVPGTNRRVIRVIASIGLLVFLAASLSSGPQAPGRALGLLVGAVFVVTFFFPNERLRLLALEERDAPRRDPATLPSVFSLVVGLDIWLHPTAEASARQAALTLVFLAPFAATPFFGGRASTRGERSGAALAMLFAFAPIASMLAESEFLALGLLAPLTHLLLVGARLARAPQSSRAPSTPTVLGLVLVHPSRVLVTSFAALSLVGSVILRLPIVTETGTPIRWIDAAFTAVSASCVTGLGVVDTETTFSAAGEVAILALIQVGGLGIMVFSAAAVAMLGGRLSISHERTALALVGAPDRAGLDAAIRAVLRVTFATEIAGAALLMPAFLRHGDSFGAAAWRALFTSISAFCNAGFALQSDSLVGFAESPYVLTVVATILVIGGLGPFVIVTSLNPHRKTRLPVHVRIVLVSSALLLVLPALFIAVIEWNGALADLSPMGRMTNAAFQSATLRTAGFNSVDLTKIQPATHTMMIALMFIGGSPGSTAGGAKTTTIAVLALAVLAVVRGRRELIVYGRAIRPEIIIRATAVAAVGVVSCIGALFTLQLTQDMPLDMAIFEVVSALATVGLSTGGTGQLDDFGKVLVIACMFAGRVGPLSLFVFVAQRSAPLEPAKFAAEDVPVG